MFTASFEVRTPEEFSMLGQFLDILQKVRASAAQPPTVVDTAPAPTAPVETAPAPTAPVETAPAAVDDITLANAFKAYAMRTDLPALHELLKEFGVSRVTEIPSDRRAEFMTRISS